jgi:hypothetical protein
MPFLQQNWRRGQNMFCLEARGWGGKMAQKFIHISINEETNLKHLHERRKYNQKHVRK